MSTERILIHGTTAQRMGTTPALGQIGSDDDTGQVILGDGVTPGGIPMAKESQLPAPSRMLPVPGDGDTGKVVVVNESENGFELVEVGGSDAAESINYDNTESGLAAENVQGAIDELAGSRSLLRGFISGYTMSNDAVSPNTKVNVSAGSAIDVDNTSNIDGAAGSIDCATVGANGLDAGTLANNTWYSAFVIAKEDGSIARLASLSPVAPTLPAGYTKLRRIGSFKTNSSAQIIKFHQRGFDFFWDVPVSDHVQNNPGTSAILVQLSVPDSVVVRADFSFYLQAADGVRRVALITSPSQADTPPAPGTMCSVTAGYTSVNAAVQTSVQRWTNTSRQIRYRMDGSAAGTGVFIVTNGWHDPL